jgi:beta-lactamase regulating signal transducer with metallopeptidase domain
MTSTINEAAVALGRLVELSILGKATTILVIGLTVVRLSRRARASVRHLLLAATLAAVLALPLIILAAPEVLIGVPASQASESTDLGPAAPSVALTATTITSLPSRATESATWSLPSWMTIARTVWLAGAFLLLAQLAVDLRRLYRTRREGLIWMESRELMQWLASECGVRRNVEVLLHEGIPGPLTCGIWRPAILLPDDASEWNEADLRRAIVHELEHVRRGDWAIQLAARVTCIFYWFHPLVWVALRRLSLEAERAADDAVVRSAEHTEYAEQLVLLAGRLSKAQAQTALGMANRSDLSARVSALLDDSQRRGRAGRRPTATVLSVAGLVVFTLAPVRAVTLPRKQTAASAQAPGSQSNTTENRVAPSAQTPGSQSKITRNRVGTGLDRALVRAATDGDLAGIEELLRAGANVNCTTDNGQAGNPLIGAAQEGHLEAVRLLLDWGADPNLVIRDDGTPLIAAARDGRTDVVALLLDRGARIDQIVPGYFGNALNQASRYGRLGVVKLLVARGADVNARVWDNTEETVKVSWQSGKEQVARISVRVKPGGKGEWHTPLGMARRGPPWGYPSPTRRRERDAVIDFLIASGAQE